MTVQEKIKKKAEGDKDMTREEFKKQIEYSLNHFITKKNTHFWETIHLKATIARTLRLAIKYPNLAQEYFDSLPKVAIKKKELEDAIANLNKQIESL